MKYVIINFIHLDGTEGFNVLRILDNEVVTLGLGNQDPEYLAWIADGNIVEEWINK